MTFGLNTKLKLDVIICRDFVFNGLKCYFCDLLNAVPLTLNTNPTNKFTIQLLIAAICGDVSNMNLKGISITNK